MRIAVALVDDRRLFREGLKLLLGTQEDLPIAGEASNPAEAYSLLAEKAVDVCVVAQELEGSAGLTVARELAHRHPSLRLIITAASGSADGARAALSAGARGYVLKSQASADLFEAVRTVMRGDVYLPPPLALQASTWRVRPAPEAACQPLSILSARERQVFELLVRGHTNASIGRMLGISAKTVDTHRTKVLRKIGVHSIVDLVRFAARNQLPLD
jgi:DNA-binding NarL/FixJ family response regulator